MNLRMKQIIFCLLLLVSSLSSTAQKDTNFVIKYFGSDSTFEFVGKKAYLFVDSSAQMNFEQVKSSANFQLIHQEIPNVGVSKSNFWVRITVENLSLYERILFELETTQIKEVALYFQNENGDLVQRQITKDSTFNNRGNVYQNPTFTVVQERGTTVTYYLKLNSNTQITIPLKVGSFNAIYDATLNRDLLSALYFGIMLVMFFYNLFIYYSVKDRSYFYYILYILSVSLVQLSVTGLGFKYLWPTAPQFEQLSIYLFPSLTAFTSIAFFHRFLNIRKYAPKTTYLLWFFIISYCFTLYQAIWGDKWLAYNSLNVNALPLALIMIGIAAWILWKHRYRPAMFFLIAWTVFLLGIIVFVMKEVGVLPYNIYTFSSIQIGSALETVLLSIALADRINTLKAEKEQSQQQVLLALKENERIVKEQNVLLEAKVKERTHELVLANKEIEAAMTELQEKETQLVESEKMASLGQLTAGIAHEINNPINFVTSNVNPLKRDINVLLDVIHQLENLTLSEEEKARKQEIIEEIKEEADFEYLLTEIDHLIKGISEGASRTAEIVKGLRVFSRLDEDDLKRAEINEGLDSTIVIVNHLLNNVIEVEKDFAELPMIECYPGKLNQVFLNIMSNAIYAIHKRWSGTKGGKLWIMTRKDEKTVKVIIRDNGTGMDEATKQKLFEPFFTTKDVGEGTGLGMSIVYNTIKKHNGTIDVASTLGEGTEFVINLPIFQF